MVWVNAYKRLSPGSPFGGTGMSGYGREMGFEAIHEYTQAKSVWINVGGGVPDYTAADGSSRGLVGRPHPAGQGRVPAARCRPALVDRWRGTNGMNAISQAPLGTEPAQP
jgi:hypothetical protein